MIICIDLILSREIWIAEICRLPMGMSIQIPMEYVGSIVFGILGPMHVTPYK